jgi:hypothetical protein
MAVACNVVDWSAPIRPPAPKRQCVAALPTLGDDTWLHILSFLWLHESARARRVCRRLRSLLSSRPLPHRQRMWLFDHTDMQHEWPFLQLQRPRNLKLVVDSNEAWASRLKSALASVAAGVTQFEVATRYQANDSIVAEAVAMVAPTVQTLFVPPLYAVWELQLPALTHLRTTESSLGAGDVERLTRSGVLPQLDNLFFGVSSSFLTMEDARLFERMFRQLTRLRTLQMSMNAEPPELWGYTALASQLEKLTLVCRNAWIHVTVDKVLQLTPLRQLRQLIFYDAFDKTEQQATQHRALRDQFVSRPTIEFRDID